MKKRLFTVLLAVCLVLALGTVSALADDTLPASGEITLDSNVVLSSTWSITGDVVLDLNGNSISVDSTAFASGVGYAIDIQPGGSLTVNDSGSNGSIYSDVQNVGLYLIRVLPTGELIVNDGTIENNYTDFSAQAPISNFGTVTINGGEVNGSTLMRNHAASWAGEEYSQYFDKSTILNVTGGRLVGMDITTAIKHPEDPNYIGFSYGVSFFGSGIDDDGKYNNDSVIVNISGGYIEADQALATNASSGKYAGFTLNVTDGTINGTDEGTAMYLPGIGNTTISGGTITGAQGIRIASGELNITRGEIISTAGGDIDDIIAGGSGGTNGALVIGKAGTGYVGDLIVNVSGTASIKNTSTEENPTAIFVTDKTMKDQSYKDTVIIVNIEDSVIDGDVIRASDLTNTSQDEKCDTTTLTISDVTVNGIVVNQSQNGSMSVIGSNLQSVQVADGTNGYITVIESDVKEEPTDRNVVLVDSKVNGEDVTNTAGYVAIVNGVPYSELQAAINAADERGVITLINNVTAASEITIDKSLKVDGQGHEINLTAQTNSQALSIGNTTTRDIAVTFDNVDLTIKGTTGTGADAIDVWAEFNITNSNIEMSSLRGAFVMQGGMDAKVNLDGSIVNVHDITGNGSNGGVWDINNSSMTFTNVESHALSTENLAVTSSNLTFNNIGLIAVYGQKIDLNDGANVVITNGGTELPSTGYDGTEYNQPIQIKTVANVTGNYLTVDNGASVSITGKNDGIYVSAGTTYTNNGTVNANIVMEAASAGQNTVKVINNGVTIYSGYVADNASFELPTPDSRNGYTFGGWRYGNTVYKAGETVTVNSDMTFTAVWSAINIPDTYDIKIADAANGSVDTSLSNASAGSTITITATPDSGYSVASVTVTGPDGRVDVVRVNATTYTFKMPAGDVTVRVTFTDSDALPFTDVSANQWFYEAVAYVYTNGMMEGDSATTFNPDGTMTRAMFWAVLGRIDGATITGTNWADQARDWAMAEGVSDGTDPNGLVTREQMVTMLWRYAVAKGYDVSIGESTNILSYADFGQISEYAIPAMQWGCGSGVITGMTDTTLVPQGTATRAQCAAIFLRFDQM